VVRRRLLKIITSKEKKKAKLQWLQSPSGTNGDKLNNIRRQTSRHFRNNKKRENPKDKNNELATKNKNNNIRDLHRRINEFNRGYQPKSNLVKDENGDLFANFHNISNLRTTVTNQNLIQE
jgi:hypothetical protein